MSIAYKCGTLLSKSVSGRSLEIEVADNTPASNCTVYVTDKVGQSATVSVEVTVK